MLLHYVLAGAEEDPGRTLRQLSGAAMVVPSAWRGVPGDEGIGYRV